MSERNAVLVSSLGSIPDPKIYCCAPVGPNASGKLDRPFAEYDARRWFEESNNDASAAAIFDSVDSKEHPVPATAYQC